MNKFAFLSLLPLAIGLLQSGNLYADTPTFTFKNTTSFYLNPKDPGAGCPTVQIAPGADINSTSYWCGFVACATKDYDKEKGCLEKNSDKSGLTEGGYATWFSISFGEKSCTVPDGNIYECKLNNGSLSFLYKNITQKYSHGPKQGQSVELSKPSTYNKGPRYRGVNVSGLEYDGTFLDAMYQHPDLPDIRYFVDKGMNTIRLPIRWEFLLSTDGKNHIESQDPVSPYVNSMYLDSVYDTVEKYLSGGVAVDLDLHNYMRFCKAGSDVGQANEPTDPIANNCDVMDSKQLAYIWGVIAKRFEKVANQYPDLMMFEIMNEPYTFVDKDGKPVPNQTIKTEDLFKSEVAAVKEIRKYAKNNYILLSGNYWDPLHGWVNETPIAGDVPNGTVFTASKLQAEGIDVSRIIIDMHQYFDYNYSGTHKECKNFASYNEFKQVLALEDVTGTDIFGKWMKDNNMKVFLGEFGASDDNICKQDLDYMLRYVDEHTYDESKPNDGGFIGWTAWRANRHGGGEGFAPFNFLQDADYTVYGAAGSKESSPAGTGIARGQGNSLMDSIFNKYLNR